MVAFALFILQYARINELMIIVTSIETLLAGMSFLRGLWNATSRRCDDSRIGNLRTNCSTHSYLTRRFPMLVMNNRFRNLENSLTDSTNKWQHLDSIDSDIPNFSLRLKQHQRRNESHARNKRIRDWRQERKVSRHPSKYCEISGLGSPLV